MERVWVGAPLARGAAGQTIPLGKWAGGRAFHPGR